MKRKRGSTWKFPSDGNRTKKRRGSSTSDLGPSEQDSLKLQKSQDKSISEEDVKRLLFSSSAVRPNGSYSTWIDLCRIMTRAIALKGPQLEFQSHTPYDHISIKIYKAFEKILLNAVAIAEHPQRELAIRILMQLFYQKIERAGRKAGSLWTSGLYPELLKKVTDPLFPKTLRESFFQENINPSRDARKATFRALRSDVVRRKLPLESRIAVLANIDVRSERSLKGQELLAGMSNRVHEKSVDERLEGKEAILAWVSLLRESINKRQRDTLLRLIAHRKATWLPEIDHFHDFFSDSFRMGGSLLILTLSVMFDLLKERNFDHPHFYKNLYFALSPETLHSKDSQRLLYLSGKSLSSTHLSASLVASFLKRFSRYCLFCPLPAIVMGIPWIYNLLQSHRSCTSMIHRKPVVDIEELSMAPKFFDIEISDPANTGAIASSIWEIETLRSHYHHPARSLASIIAEQFTRERYALSDFANTSYSQLTQEELFLISDSALENGTLFALQDGLFCDSLENKWDFCFKQLSVLETLQTQTHTAL